MAGITNSINNTVGGSNSGATNTFTVTNSSNTASSKALVNVTVGGSTADDAFTTYTVSGVTNWSQGVDNSDSDAYVLAASTALGTTNVIHASTAGILNYPLQPAFSAIVASAAANITGDGTTYTIPFASEIFDQGSNYNNGTYTYTSPVTGRHLITVGLGLNGLAAGHTRGQGTLITSNRNYLAFDTNIGAMRGSGNDFNIAVSSTVDMDAGDTALVQITVSGATKVVGTRADGTHAYCAFGGFLLA
jgi:hypothetical protein